MEPSSQEAFEFLDLEPQASDLLDDALNGLSSTPKYLPCKYFYDERGSQLFEQISELPQYYLTRSELEVMRNSSATIAEHLGPGCMVIELGSGNSLKTRCLLNELRAPAAYVPVEISRNALRQSCARLHQEYPKLELLPVCVDFTKPFPLPTPRVEPRRKVIYFPGSTIGNFTPKQVIPLLEIMVSVLGRGGALVLGIDLKKDPRVLHRAYNDARGITAAFNLNLLARLNRELGADFELDCFRHYAFYNPPKSRIEMHLVSTRDQSVMVQGEQFDFGRGESIRTEYSYKYDPVSFAVLARDTGLRMVDHWTDRHRHFGVLQLEVADD
jgi:dimethylhistidine N-methyltransferase